ncbi:MAG: hypothetical protein ACHREM_00920 [Polyangiales bacterium]
MYDGRWFDNECGRCGNAGFATMMREPHVDVYLWFCVGSLVIAADKPSPDYQLADPRRVPTNIERHHVVAWVRERSTRLPIIPADAAE